MPRTSSYDIHLSASERNARSPYRCSQNTRRRPVFIQTEAAIVTAMMNSLSSLVNQCSPGRCKAVQSHVLPQLPLVLAYPRTFFKTPGVEPVKGISGGIAARRKPAMQIARSRRVERNSIRAGTRSSGVALISEASPKRSRSRTPRQHSSA